MTSGWYLLASAQNARLISASDAVPGTPRTSYRSRGTCPPSRGHHRKRSLTVGRRNTTELVPDRHERRLERVGRGWARRGGFRSGRRHQRVARRRAAVRGGDGRIGVAPGVQARCRSCYRSRPTRAGCAVWPPGAGSATWSGPEPQVAVDGPVPLSQADGDR